jgi:tetratricopeptide (TPR) repeat protein
MVSTIFLTATLTLALAAQSSPPGPEVQAQTFRPDTKKDGLTAPTPAPGAKPDATVTPELRGDIYMARKMYREAIDAYKSAPQTAILVNKTGIAYHQMVQLNTAKKYYERAIKMNRKYSEALNNLGTVYYAQKSYRRAISQYNKALRVTPQSASIWSNLGTAEFARKKYDQAMKCYEKAMAIDPDVFEHHSNAGVLLQERSVEERAKFHYYQAKLYAKKGMNDRALLYLRKALEEGLKEERDKIKAEPDFEGLLDVPEFKELLATQQRVL